MRQVKRADQFVARRTQRRLLRLADSLKRDFGELYLIVEELPSFEFYDCPERVKCLAAQIENIIGDALNVLTAAEYKKTKDILPDFENFEL